MNDKIIEKIDGSYLTFFPNNGYFSICSNLEEAKKAKNEGNTLKPVNIYASPSMYTLHITNRCNLYCDYCFANSDLKNNIDMSESTLELIIARIAETKSTQLCIDFHGGEPLVRFDLIEYCLSLCDELLKDKNITFTIQTNGTLINEKMCRVFKERNFVIGISLDGPKHIHDRNRKYATGKGSFKLVMNRIELLRKHQIPFSIISVVSKPEEMLETYNFFLEQKIKRVKFLPVMPQGRANKQLIDLKKYAEYEGMLLDFELNSSNPILLLSTYFMLRKIFYVDNSYMCMRKPCGAGINIISFDENGTILPCDSMSGINAIKNFSFGNVKDQNLNFHKLERWKSFINDSTNLIEPCSKCQYRNICCGGCKSDTLNFYGDFCNPSPLCIYYKNVLNQYYAMITKSPNKIIEYLKMFEK